MFNGPYRRLLRASVSPLVVTASDPAGISVLRVDPELLWAACLGEFEEVEIRTLDDRTWRVPIVAGSVGEIEVLGPLGRQVLPGDILSVLAYTYAADRAAADHKAHFVHVGEGNRAIEISCRKSASFPVHPSLVQPAAADTSGTAS